MKITRAFIIFSVLLAVITGCNSGKENREDVLYNKSASLTGKIGTLDAGELLKWHMITLLKDTKSNIVSVLYANDAAFKSARQGNNAYSKGSSLALVSWLEKPDTHWFGATIPGKVHSITKIDIITDNNGQQISKYSAYLNGKQGITEVTETDAQLVRKNTNFILGIKRPYLPD